jgi:hypothetical protein
MKTTQIFQIIIALVIFTSCNPYDLDDNTIYWNTNALVRMQLKGNVKQVKSMNGTNIVNFTSHGLISDITHNSEYLSYTETYDYTNNRLVSISRNTTLGKTTGITEINFDYQNFGKYILQDKYMLLTDALIPNLKSKSGNPTTTYSMDGETLYIVENYQGGNIDSTIVEYTDKYPTRIIRPDGTEVKDFEYASNGMFKKYAVYSQAPTWQNKATYYFHPDNQYLMLDSMVQVHVEGSFTRKDIDIYQYDSNKNLILFKNYMGENKYTYPDLDSNGNWLTKEWQYRSNSTQNWSSATTETRTITYY